MSELAASRRLPRAFVALALAFGLGFIVINPPFAVNDEDMHLARLYELSSGRLFTRIDASGEYQFVPVDYVELSRKYETINPPGETPRVQLSKLWRELTAPCSDQEVRIWARTGGYNPLGYGPQILAVWIVRHFDVSALVHMYAARVASLIQYVALAWLAILISGELQWLFMAIALTPMVLTQAAGVSADGTVIGLSLLFFALAARAIFRRQPLTRRELLGLALCAIVLTVCKPVYVLVVTCLPALFWTRVDQRLRSVLLLLAICTLGLGGYLGWLALMPEYVGPSVPGFGAEQQLALLRDHPLRLVSIALRTIYLSGDALITELVFVRRRLSWMIHFSSALGVVLYLQLLLGLAFGSLWRVFPGQRRLRRVVASWFLLSAGAIALAVPSAIYLCCTEVGADKVNVLQGRYFLPALPALLLACAFVGRPVVARWLRAGRGHKVYAVIGFTNLWCLFTLIGFHYFGTRIEWPL